MCAGMAVFSMLYQEGRSHTDKPLDLCICLTHRHELQDDLASLYDYCAKSVYHFTFTCRMPTL